MAKDDLNKKIEARRKQLSDMLKNQKMTKLDITKFVKVGGEKTIETFIPTGLPAFDNILTDIANPDNVGIVAGKIIEIMGPSQSGKTFLATQIMKTFQNLDVKKYPNIKRRVLFIDAENTYYDIRFKVLGVDVDDPELWMMASFPSAEQNAEFAEACIKSGEFGCVVVDSVTALIPAEELDKSFEDNQSFGLHARFMSRFMRKMVEPCKTHNTTLLLINQLRVGKNSRGDFVDKGTGGQALEFYSHLRFKMQALNSKDSKIVDSDGEIIAGKSTIEIIKSRYHKNFVRCEVAIPFVEAEADPLANFAHSITNNFKLRQHMRYYYKAYQYYAPEDTDMQNVLASSKDIKEFIRMLCELPAPEKLAKGDTTSQNAFDYVTFVAKYSDDEKAVVQGMAYLEDDPTTDDEEAEE